MPDTRKERVTVCDTTGVLKQAADVNKLVEYSTTLEAAEQQQRNINARQMTGNRRIPERPARHYNQTMMPDQANHMVCGCSSVLLACSDVKNDIDRDSGYVIGVRLSSQHPILSHEDVEEGLVSGFADLSEIMSLFNFLMPSVVDAAEGFKESSV